MTASNLDFSGYLESIVRQYERWWEIDALTARIAARQATFTFEQKVQTEEKDSSADSEARPDSEAKPKIRTLNLIPGIQEYAKVEPVLLVGSPGMGKSSALLRCLVEYAKQELAKPEPERIPVLIQLRRYQGNLVSSDDPAGMLALIKNALKPKFKRGIAISEIEDWLFEGRLILLLDGLNEMPSSSVRTQLRSFCEDLDQTPLICSTRESGVGDLGISRKLVIQPPDSKEINRFLCECIPTAQVQKVESLLNRDRRELNRTPFVLWMLYHVIQETGTVPATLGEAFRKFFRFFKGRLEAAPVTDDRRQAWDRWLRHLAFTMLSSPDPQDPGLVIAEEDAEAVLFEAFPPPYKTPSLSELLKYHLLQEENGKITFHHQLIQEYYAAEALLKLDNLTDKELKCDYLNHLKWTEPIALMLALLEDSKKALQIVQWALDVDLMLGARLAGEVKPDDLQRQTVELVNALEMPPWLKVELLGETRSRFAIPALRHFIQDSDFCVRSRALEALGEIGHPDAVPHLIRALQDSDSRLGEKAVWALGEIGQGHLDTIPILIDALQHSDSAVKREAVKALGKIVHPDVVSALIEVCQNLVSFEEHEAQEIFSEMVELGNSAVGAALIEKMIQHPNALVRQCLTKLLNRTCNPDAIPILIKVLQHPQYANFDLLATTVCILGEIGNSAVVPALTEILQHPNHYMHINTSTIYDAFILIKSNQDSVSYVRFLAANALGEIGDPAAVPALIETLQDPNYFICESAVSALGKIGDPTAVSALMEALKHPVSSVRDLVISTLGQTGNSAVLPVLIETLQHWNFSEVPRDRRKALELHGKIIRVVKALGKIGNSTAVPTLIETLQHPMSGVRASAAEALGRIGHSSAIPAIINALQDSYEVQSAAESALCKMGDLATVDVLIESLRQNSDHSVRIRISVASVLGKIGNPVALPALTEALQDPASGVRSHAVEALGRIQHPDAVSASIEVLQDSYVQKEAVEAVGKIGHPDAVPHLIHVLQYSHFSVGEKAAEALGNFKNDRAAHILPDLLKLISQDNQEAFRALTAIQANCKFYNYEIYQQAQARREQERPQAKGEIDFAILTAIPTEHEAICKAFNITNEDRVRHASRTYWRKRFPLKNGKFYEIVVAQCLDAGTGNAALLTNDILHHWKPAAVLMVGIAAAATPKQQLGNLVIGREVYYYETGAITATGKLPEPKQIPVDATLLDRAQALPKTNFSIPVAHPDGIPVRPEIEPGVIASGDKVIKDAAERDKIAAANRKIRAIEMEGYGVLNAAWQHFNQVRCLVIRALCDYADAAKNDQWHAYAAAVAAGYTHHFLADEPLEPRNAITDR